MADTWTVTISDKDEEFVKNVVQPLRKYINETPELLSLLYDIDLLPEQIKLPVNAVRLEVFVNLWKKYVDKGK